MAASLADFQENAIYLDTNVLVGLVDASSVYHPACAAFFHRAVDPNRPIQLFTATFTLDEVRHPRQSRWLDERDRLKGGRFL